MRIRSALSIVAVLALLIGPAVVACGSENSAGSDAGIPGFVEGGNNPQIDGQVLLEKDPFPKWCGPASGKTEPPPPSGTEDCPDDKNVEGCPCPQVGTTAPCWPGKRANRHLGQCKDGTAKCLAQGELGKVWGKCEGAVLPTGTSGPAACTCFSGGSWKIKNIVPCFVTAVTGGVADYYATSAACPPPSGGPAPGKGKPTPPWSTDTVTIDCEGHFKLCFTIKVGDAANPSPADCSITTVCTEGDYLEKNKEQAFPDLPGWFSDDDACVKKAVDGGALYFEMTVNGNSFFCDEVGTAAQPLMFNRKPYCKLNEPCSPDALGSFP